MNNEAGSIVISVKARVEGWEKELEAMKKAMANVDISGGLGKKLKGEID